MTRLETLTEALRYIEQRLCAAASDMPTTEDIARHCHYSVSALQKLFRHAFHIGVADYVARRRLTLASRALLQTEDSVLDIALRYGYASHEVFTRAFRRIWGIPPSQFRRERTFADIFPRLAPPQGGLPMYHRCYDLTELYDYLRTLDGTIALTFDTCHLDPINTNYGRAAGDLVIAECLRRIDQEKGDDMLLIRIGGDEYALLTGLTDEAEAEELNRRIIAHNGETIAYGDTALPVSLHCGSSRLNTARQLKYDHFFKALDESIRV